MQDNINSIVYTKDGSNTLFSKFYNQHYHNPDDGAINEALTKCGITTITAKYSEFSGGITISSNTTGQSQKFDISYISNSGATTTKNVVGQNAQVADRPACYLFSLAKLLIEKASQKSHY